MTPPTDHDLLLAALRFQGGPTPPTLLPARTPQAAPAALPELAGLLGSIETPADGDWYAASLYFSPVPSAESDAFIRRANAELRALGWRDAKRTPRSFWPSGFQPSEMPLFPQEDAPAPDPGMVLLHDAGKVAACWDMRLDEQAGAFLCLSVQPHAYRHWARQDAQPAFALPPLSAPAGWTLETIGGGGGGNQRATNARSSALLRGAGMGQDLYAHFAGQLDDFGWTEQAAIGTETLTVASWRTPQDDFALLTLAQRETALWQVGLEMTRLHDGGGDGAAQSWFSF